MNSRLQFFIGVLLILLAVFSRLLPHPMNFAPLMAIALFGGFYFDKRIAPILPLTALVVSDYFLGFYEGIEWVYGSFLLVVIMGMIAKRFKSISVVYGTSLLGTTLFYLITNFAVWKSGVYYTLDFNGLVTCYIAALPFFRNAILGDLFYVTVLFGVYEMAVKYAPSLTTTKA
jgi:hypothetical protein